MRWRFTRVKRVPSPIRALLKRFARRRDVGAAWPAWLMLKRFNWSGRSVP